MERTKISAAFPIPVQKVVTEDTHEDEFPVFGILVQQEERLDENCLHFKSDPRDYIRVQTF